MSGLRKGLVLAAIHLAIVGSLGGKLLYDRATRPRVWVETTPFDPDLPIRGRYVSLSILVASTDVDPPADDPTARWRTSPVTLHVENDRLVARHDPAGSSYSGPAVRFIKRDARILPVLDGPVAYFIPEHVPDPSRRPAGETLWVEVTVPRQGPPRPIRLGVKKGDTLTPLELR